MKKILAIIIFSVLLSTLAQAFPIPPGGAPEGPFYDNGTCSSSVAIDYKKGNSQGVTLGANCTVSWVLPPSGYWTSVILKVTQHFGVHYNITWTSTTWDSGLVPLITQSDGAVNFISCFIDSVGVYCTSGMGAFY